MSDDKSLASVANIPSDSALDKKVAWYRKERKRLDDLSRRVKNAYGGFPTFIKMLAWCALGFIAIGPLTHVFGNALGMLIGLIPLGFSVANAVRLEHINREQKRYDNDRYRLRAWDELVACIDSWQAFVDAGGLDEPRGPLLAFMMFDPRDAGKRLQFILNAWDYYLSQHPNSIPPEHLEPSTFPQDLLKRFGPDRLLELQKITQQLIEYDKVLAHKQLAEVVDLDGEAYRPGTDTVRERVKTRESET